MTKKIILIGGQTIGSPTEIYEALHGNNHKVVMVNDKPFSKAFLINAYCAPELVRLPLTRKERRKQKRK